MTMVIVECLAGILFGNVILRLMGCMLLGAWASRKALEYHDAEIDRRNQGGV